MEPDNPEWRAKLAKYDGKPWPDMDFHSVVRMTERAPEEVRGMLGYILGWAPESDPPGLGVWVYDLAEVWLIEADIVEPMGWKDEIAANASKGAILRVSKDGDLL
jgi:hypothetical protein